MITNSESNVKFTDEQTRQLETWQLRLTNIQNEIRKSEVRSKVVFGEVGALEKHREFLTKENSNIEGKLNVLLQQKLELEKEVEKSHKMLNSHMEETNKRVAFLTEKENQHSMREKSLVEAHAKLSKEKEAHTIKNAKLSEQQLLVEKAQEAFIKATESVLWKK